MKNLENSPALLYSVFWQTREMGFLDKILKNLNINKLSILFFFRDYKPGALIRFDGIKGDFEVITVQEINDIEFDGALIGEIKYLLELIKGHMFLKGIWYIITRKLKFKGIKGLLKFLKLLQEVAY